MPEFILAYHGNPDHPKTPEEGKAHMEKWKAWLGELGDAVVNPGTPVGPTRLISSEGVTDDDSLDPMSGFTVVKADDIDAALGMAKTCPYLDIGGTLKVSELMDIKM